MGGCPFNTGVEKRTLNYTLIDYYDTTEDKIKEAGHVPGPKCRCRECNLLKDLENKWIMKVGSLYGISGLNLRDEMKSQIRWNTRN